VGLFPTSSRRARRWSTLEEIYAGRGIDIHQVRQRLNQVARELGLPFSERKMTYNSRLAQELAKWAESKGVGEEFHRAVFRAYYVDTKNIGKVDELLRLAASVGLPQEEAKGSLNKDPTGKQWMRIGNDAMISDHSHPGFVIDRECVVGLQPYESSNNSSRQKYKKRT